MFITHVIEERLPPDLRLDRFVSEYMRLLSRSQIKARKLCATVNGKNVKLSKFVRQGDILELRWEELPPEDIVPQDIPLDIVYEDERCVVINKAQGMVVHPGAGNRQDTLANAVYFRMLKKKGDAVNGFSGVRPGIVHRLDKDTSGIIICAYDNEAHDFLSRQFKSRKVKKTYAAIVMGTPKEKKGCIETYIARDTKDRKRYTVSSFGIGKNAITYYKVIKSWKKYSKMNDYSLVMLRPKTGRTHQLRVHLKHLGHPILGDPIYGIKDKNFPDAALMLHSKSLTITLPSDNCEHSFSSPLPERFISILNKI